MKFTRLNLQEIREKAAALSTRQKQEQIRINIGMGSCGIAAGAKEVMAAFKTELKENRLKNIKLEITGCLGNCHEEPIVEIISPNKPATHYRQVQPALVKKIVKENIIRAEELKENKLDPAQLQNKQLRIVLRNCGIINPEKIDEYLVRDGYQALEKVLFEMSPDQVLEEIRISGLRGRGGAGYPTSLKWSFTKNAVDKVKYIVCNADEGDPGAYMDRSTLEGDPHSILEAMTIAGYTVGAQEGYIYIRAEYPLAIKRLNLAIAQAKEYGLLGENILGSNFSFNIELRLGAGAFVCGEETALLASIEGERGMPKPRPPFPATKGLWNKPTVINNVETWANIPVIINKGGSWFAKIGTDNSKGTKVFALTGKISKSSLIEVPMGTTLREIIYDIGGGIINNKKFKAVQTGGPSGGVIPKEHLDTPIDYDNLIAIGSMMGSGGMIVMDENDCMIDVTKFYLQFSVDESCGKCAPCRIGGYQLLSILEKISKGQGSEFDIYNLKRIAKAMQKASLCGLGQTASNPVLSTLNYFKKEYKEHIVNKKCRAGKCVDLIQYKIDQKKCTKCSLCQRICPTEAISGDKKTTFIIDQEKCIKCGKCFEKCKFAAILKE
ncbi:MAG: NADH-quinone oxidoreductase subunit NuoF [Candidatus Margulisbacteria bacterium]|nr:NADH-quinone oxidoreductase subunit NuoF [Candidatus Margulisiibacteriota bacterium]